MFRYLVEQSFPTGLLLTIDQRGAVLCREMVRVNLESGVTWIHSYVTPDRRHAYCICDAPSPEAIRCAAEKNGLFIHRITEVRLLDPYFLF